MSTDLHRRRDDLRPGMVVENRQGRTSGRLAMIFRTTLNRFKENP